MRSRFSCKRLAALGHQLTDFAATKNGLSVQNVATTWKLGPIAFPGTSSSQPASFLQQYSSQAVGTSSSWEQLKKDGIRVNPCQSPHHPAAVEGVAEPEGEELCVQEAYNPESRCFGCGHAHPDGLHLQSRRIPGVGLGRLEARISFDPKYCAFPGIINGGVLTTAMDCHGNWAAAIALMDKGCLPRPPLTMTASMQVSFRAPTPPDTQLVMRSRVLGIKENSSGGPLKATVEVEVVVVHPEQGPAGEALERVLAVGTGVYKRLGALRSM
ncbi:hypothetical protein Vretimale_11689 [Volvox reticuliferus]|uniref:Thioesterase domain-containing protein n=2 Tax=Volvox reticuliferus TaxID=1737510 RepID=A0A8J4FUC4_9CHLO|nr:hypothetical protein Vretifemale_14665 [Volvox reticuliferus]GIM07608.1 hypothetical protein Vretimale_11689 [Volvox reticuliferus]